MTPEEIEDNQEVDKIKSNPKVRRAIEDSSGGISLSDSATSTNNRSDIIVILSVLVGCAILYYLFGWKYFPIRNRYIPLVQNLLLVIVFSSIVILFARLARKILKKKVDNATTLYNLKRITDLVAAVIIFFIILSLVFANWYAAMVSFGIISLILGLALQNPITSFFAWLYLLIRKPYEVGDRIKIGNVKGDVIDVGYIDTTLWEFNGEYLSGDHPSGRIIRFSNSKVFNEYVYNYSWPLFPFIWNEMNLFVAYESDLQFVSETARSFVEKEVGESMVRRVKRYKKILGETPIDDLDVREVPSVILRAHDNTWIEVVVRYLVEPKLSGQVKRRIFENLIEELNKYPEKVMFPNSSMR